MRLLQVMHQLVYASEHPCISQFSLLPLTVAKLDISNMVAIMMLKKAKPAEFRRIKYCHCKKSMCRRGCFCVRANVKCVLACLCTGTQQMFND